MRVIVESSITQEGQTDRIRTEAQGRLYQKGGAWYLLYKEPEASGLAGVGTTIKTQGGSVTILRTDPYPSRMVIAPGKTHFAPYPTEAGTFDLAVRGERVAVLLKENGGRIHLEYTLSFLGAEDDITPAETQHITMEIQVGDTL